jgi:hypothetical protein
MSDPHPQHSMTYLCERCRRNTELTHCRSVDEYLCEDCIVSLAEKYFGRHQVMDPDEEPSEEPS